MKEWRPQILTAMLSLLLIAGASMWLGYEEIALTCPAGIVALGMRLLEGSNSNA